MLGGATTSLSEVVAESKDLVFAYLSAGLGFSPCCFTTPEAGRSSTMTSGGLSTRPCRDPSTSYGQRFTQAKLRSG